MKTALLGALGAVALAAPACSADLEVPNIDLKFTAGASCAPQAASDSGPPSAASDGGTYQALPSEQCGAGLLCFNTYSRTADRSTLRAALKRRAPRGSRPETGTLHIASRRTPGGTRVA